MRPERLRNFEQHSCKVRVQVFYSSLSHPKTWGLVTTLYYRVSCTPKQMSTHYCRQQPRWNSCWLHLGSVEQVSHSGSQSWLISLLVVLVPAGMVVQWRLPFTTTMISRVDSANLTGQVGVPFLTLQSVGSPPEARSLVVNIHRGHPKFLMELITVQ